MPTYEYECQKCGYVFERFQSMSEEPVKRCPKCRCKVKRLLGTGAGIIFKGSGFYETDYKKKSQSSSPSTGSTESKTSSDTGKPDSKDSKPAPKADAPSASGSKKKE